MQTTRALAAIGLSALVGADHAAARDADDPPQHIARLDYAIASDGVPSYWNGTQTGHYNLDFGLTIDAVSPDTGFMYWANQFKLGNTEGWNGTGYGGLQQRANGERVVIFSIWGGTIDPDNTHCNQGHELGPVASCIMPYDWQVGTRYRFRVWEIEDAERPDDPEWWGAWVMDTTTGDETFIAKIQVPGSYEWITSWVTGFVEYYGALPQGCDTPLAYSKATYHALSVDNGSFSATLSAELADTGRFACAQKLLHRKSCSATSCVIETGTRGMP